MVRLNLLGATKIVTDTDFYNDITLASEFEHKGTTFIYLEYGSGEKITIRLRKGWR